MSLYFLTIGHTVYSTRLKTQARTHTKTCIVGLPDMQTATDLRRCVESTVNKTETVQVLEMDYESPEFTSMLRLNNLALLITSDFEYNEKIVSLQGDLLDIELPVDDENRHYLDRIYETSTIHSLPLKLDFKNITFNE